MANPPCMHIDVHKHIHVCSHLTTQNRCYSHLGINYITITQQVDMHIVYLLLNKMNTWNVLYLRWLVTGFSICRPGFESSAGDVGFVVDKIIKEKVYLQVHWFSHRLSFLKCSIFTSIYHHQDNAIQILIALENKHPPNENKYIHADASMAPLSQMIRQFRVHDSPSAKKVFSICNIVFSRFSWNL